VPFDVFQLKNKENWKSVKDQFYSEVESIEGEAKNFIDESFKSLRSAEGAFDMLINFENIRSREAINSQMMKKFNDILLQVHYHLVLEYSTFIKYLLWIFCSFVYFDERINKYFLICFEMK